MGIDAGQIHILHIVLVAECGRCAQAGRYRHHPRNSPDPVHEAVVEVNVFLFLPGCDSDMRKVLHDDIKEHLLKAVLHGYGY